MKLLTFIINKIQRSGDVALGFLRPAQKQRSASPPRAPPFDPLTPNTQTRTKHEVNRMTPCGDMAI